MDQSATEANSIKQVFPGLHGGEQECDIILCTVHVMRTWMAKIYDTKARETMILAMHKKTKIGCEQLIQEAIRLCSVPAICHYIKKNYTHNNHQWALWARQHSPLLLQVTSTNALESYHSELKRTTSHVHGLIGKLKVSTNFFLIYHPIEFKLLLFLLTDFSNLQSYLHELIGKLKVSINILFIFLVLFFFNRYVFLFY